jgi:hypothetical protein
MGLLERLFGKRGRKEEIETIARLESVEEGKEEEKEEEDLNTLAEQLIMEKSETKREEVREEEGSGIGKKEEDELITSLKKEDEKVVEINFALNREIGEIGDVSTTEILELGRGILNNIRRK